MTVGQAISFATKKVKAQPNASALAFSLVALATAKPPAFLLRQPLEPLDKASERCLHVFVRRAAQGEPLAYLRGYQEFYGLRFAVSPKVLIPRPESELLVETALTRLRGVPHPHMVDIGTGSGCLAISILKSIPESTVVATDASRSALTVAERNAKAHRVRRRIRFMHGSLLKPIPDQPTDALVANLPYLSKMEARSLHPEPFLALAGGGRRGDALILNLLQEIQRRRHRPAHLLLEVDPRTARIIAKAAGRIFARVTILKDLAGLQRVVRCTQPLLSSG